MKICYCVCDPQTQTEYYWLSRQTGCFGPGLPGLILFTCTTARNGMVFTTQPVSEPPKPNQEHDNNWWVGGILPKVGQTGTTLIAMYSPEVIVANKGWLSWNRSKCAQIFSKSESCRLLGGSSPSWSKIFCQFASHILKYKATAGITSNLCVLA